MQSISSSETSTLLIATWPIPADDTCGAREFVVPEIQVALSGSGRRWLEIGLHHREVNTCPDMIEIYGAGYEIRSTRWLGRQGTCVAIQFPQRMAESLHRAGCPTLHLASRHEVFDRRISLLCRELASEHQQGRPNGAMFSEGLSIALIGLLDERYATSTTRRADVTTTLTVAQRKRIEDFIESELGGSLRIASMAALLGMSASQFSRRFKASFGIAPHQYALRRRLQTATAALNAEPTRSIADLAFALGFSSQAHFTQAFRRYIGQTPSLLRSNVRQGMSY